MHVMEIAGFDWDDANTAKCRKHGVSIAEIEYVLTSDPAIFIDYKHSLKEKRYLAINKNRKSRSVLIAFTYREYDGKHYIRPFSARYMHKKEIGHYKYLQTKHEKET